MGKSNKKKGSTEASAASSTGVTDDDATISPHMDSASDAIMAMLQTLTAKVEGMQTDFSEKLQATNERLDKVDPTTAPAAVPNIQAHLQVPTNTGVNATGLQRLSGGAIEDSTL